MDSAGYRTFPLLSQEVLSNYVGVLGNFVNLTWLAMVMSPGKDTWPNQVGENQTQDFVKAEGKQLSWLSWKKKEYMRSEPLQFLQEQPSEYGRGMEEKANFTLCAYILGETWPRWCFLSPWANSAWRQLQILKLQKSIITLFCLR